MTGVQTCALPIYTSDEWIVQRTGIRARHRAAEDETVFSLGRDALRKALDRAGIAADQLDMIIVASVSGEMLCPSTAARISEAVGADDAAVFDLAAACSGFLYGMNMADTMIRCGRAERIAVIGVDNLRSRKAAEKIGRASCRERV